jgi:hypothetical protein
MENERARERDGEEISLLLLPDSQSLVARIEFGLCNLASSVFSRILNIRMETRHTGHATTSGVFASIYIKRADYLRLAEERERKKIEEKERKKREGKKEKKKEERDWKKEEERGR